MKPILLVLDDWEGCIRQADCWNQLKGLVDIYFLDEPLQSSTNPVLQEASMLMAVRERTRLDDQAFQKLPQLKLIFQTGGHAYHIDLAAARARNIRVVSGRAVSAPLASVPELCFGLMLGLYHRIYEGNTMVQNNQWTSLLGRSLAGKQIGILGMGRHGSRVARIARDAFGMKVVGLAREGLHYSEDESFPRLPLDEILASVDILSIHLKLSNDSIDLLSAEKLALMKTNAILINTARGAIVDEYTLAAAVREERLAGAGLDVFSQEPLPTDHPLRGHPHILLTPHIGWTVREVFEEFASLTCHQYQRYLRNRLSEEEYLV